MMKVRALIPAAGYGQRMAGVTGGRPKELLYLGPLTMIEHCLEMTLASGIREVGVVVRPGKEEIIAVLEKYLARRAGDVKPTVTFLFQDHPRGVADAMRLAASFAGDAPLAVLMPDQILLNGPPALAQMLQIFNLVRENTIGAISISPERAALFGAVGLMGLEPAEGKNRPRRVVSFSPKTPGALAGDCVAGQVKGLIGVIYVPGWRDRLGHIIPNREGELDDTDLVMGLVREGKLFAALLIGLGFDLGLPAGLAAARSAWDQAAGTPCA
ncbi:MAG: sugar phosphate nucleotidyltransferase [Pseudomonadota bacterium]